MNRKLALGGLGLIVAAFLVWFLGFRDGGDGGAGRSGRGDRADSGGLGAAARARGGAIAADDRPRDGQIGAWDVDPAGPHQLEGQVLDPDDHPVEGAEVWLSSVPDRTTKTNAAGEFVFDKLVGRRYTVSARAGDLIGGPITQQLTATSPPYVIRLRRGAGLTVHVVTDADGTPVKGAQVELREALEQTATTDDAGIAKFRGVNPGWTSVVAKAPGFAPADGGTFVSGGAAEVEIKLLLRKGAAVSGTVVDERGAPVANARVVRQNAGRFWGGGDSIEKDGVTTSATGEFSFATVPVGSFRFVAYHDRLAPGTSEPVSVDGVHPTTGVKIVMLPGGTILGKIVDKAGQPVAFATVQVAPKETVDWQIWGRMRRVTADDRGEFVVRALPRKTVRLRAEAEIGASEVLDVDLSAQPEQRGLVLVLDVTGTIAGVVVDSANQPVAEAQVAAIRDIWGGGAENLGMSGFSSATTDGGGAFQIHGLADGQYKLTAHRTGMSAEGGWEQQGAMASVGDTNVRLVLPRPGGIKGTLALASGDPPKLARVTMGWQKSAPAIGGTFLLEDVQPGKHDLVVRGPEFAEKRVRDVAVTEGEVVDVGTIELERGRRIAGKVVDKSGGGVEGATVRVGEMLWTQGSGDGNDDDNLEMMMGFRTATTGADGAFAIVGIPKKGASILAEHVTLGRSDALKLPAGSGDLPDTRLALRGFGSVEGTVTHKGKPLAAMVVATQTTGGASMVTVQAGADGKYVIDRISEGKHRLSAMQMGMMKMASSEATEVEIKEGQRAVVNIDLPAGDLTVSVAIKPKSGATVNAAQVFLFRGNVAAKNGKDLMEAFTQGGTAASGMQFWTGGAAVKFEEVLPGKVTVCSIPITGNLQDSTFMQRLQAAGEHLAVYCMGIELPPSPKEQSYPQELPAMNPLPADDPT
jgi:protocatechuate 3,4-dioxygenase beta subunit